MINQRLIAILRVLLRQEDYITINDIANKIKVSNRTIRNDLKLLEPIIDELDLTLIKKTGMGVKVDGNHSLKLKAYDSLKNENLNPYPDGPEARLDYMALKISTVTSYRIYEFSEDLFVSRASIHKDLTSLKNFLSTYHLDLSRDSSKGISLQGKEKDIRNMMFDLMIKDDKYQHFLEICRSESYQCDGEFIFYGLDLTDDEIKNFLNKVTGTSNDAFKNLDLNSFSQIIVRLIISYIRLSQGNLINLSESFKERLSLQDFNDEVQSFVKAIEKTYNLKYSNDEIYYIQLFFLSYLQPNEVLTYNRLEVEAFTNYLIDAWSKELNIDFHKDHALIDNLLKHLVPVYTRVLHNIPVENTLIGEIKKMYPNTLAIVKKSITQSKEWFAMCEEDIAFLALHLATALERQKEPLNCLMIHSDGIGAHILNKQRINRLNNKIKIVKEINFNQMKEESYDNIDLIISTVKLETGNDIPIVIVNNIISDDELMLLNEIVSSYYKEKNNPKKVD